MVSKRILVTGAGGYIGRYVVKELLNLGLEVIATDLFTKGTIELDSRAKIVKKDIFSGNKNIYEELGCPDKCLHMAWKDGFIHNSNSHMLYLSKHFEFINNMIDGGLKHISIMGTMHEVGYYEGCVNEHTICNPISMYGVAKDSLRKSTFLLLKDKDVTLQWLRAFYIYGDDIRNNSIFAKIIKAEQEGKDIFPFNTGKNKYDFISVEELAKQIAACINQNQVNGIINCCSGKPISLANKVEGFIKENKFNIKLEYGIYPDREYDSPAIWGDNSKIELIMKSYLEK